MFPRAPSQDEFFRVGHNELTFLKVVPVDAPPFMVPLQPGSCVIMNNFCHPEWREYMDTLQQYHMRELHRGAETLRRAGVCQSHAGRHAAMQDLQVPLPFQPCNNNSYINNDELAPESPEPVEQQQLAPEPVEQQQLATEPVEQQQLAPEPVEQQQLAPEPVEQQQLAPEPVERQQLATEPVAELMCAAAEHNNDEAPGLSNNNDSTEPTCLNNMEPEPLLVPAKSPTVKAFVLPSRPRHRRRRQRRGLRPAAPRSPSPEPLPLPATVPERSIAQRHWDVLRAKWRTLLRTSRTARARWTLAVRCVWRQVFVVAAFQRQPRAAARRRWRRALNLFFCVSHWRHCTRAGHVYRLRRRFRTWRHATHAHRQHRRAVQTLARDLYAVRAVLFNVFQQWQDVLDFFGSHISFWGGKLMSWIQFMTDDSATLILEYGMRVLCVAVAHYQELPLLPEQLSENLAAWIHDASMAAMRRPGILIGGMPLIQWRYLWCFAMLYLPAAAMGPLRDYHRLWHRLRSLYETEGGVEEQLEDPFPHWLQRHVGKAYTALERESGASATVRLDLMTQLRERLEHWMRERLVAEIDSIWLSILMHHTQEWERNPLDLQPSSNPTRDDTWAALSDKLRPVLQHVWDATDDQWSFHSACAKYRLFFVYAPSDSFERAHLVPEVSLSEAPGYMLRWARLNQRNQQLTMKFRLRQALVKCQRRDKKNSKSRNSKPSSRHSQLEQALFS